MYKQPVSFAESNLELRFRVVTAKEIDILEWLKMFPRAKTSKRKKKIYCNPRVFLIV